MDLCVDDDGTASLRTLHWIVFHIRIKGLVVCSCKTSFLFVYTLHAARKIIVYRVRYAKQAGCDDTVSMKINMKYIFYMISYHIEDEVKTSTAVTKNLRRILLLYGEQLFKAVVME